MTIRNHKRSALPLIGWREWLSLPDLGVGATKAKIDTGARSSSLHAYDLELFRRDRGEWVRFIIHPLQRETRTSIVAEARVYDMRSVKSSNGHTALRPVISTPIAWNGQQWDIELTLANRDEMGFRMLLGREAVRDRFLIDAGKSYYGGRPPKKTAKKTNKR